MANTGETEQLIDPDVYKTAVETLFGQVTQLMANKDFVSIITFEQKDAILKALDVTFRVMSDDVVQVHFMFMDITVDGSNKNNVRVSMSMDYNEIERLAALKG